LAAEERCRATERNRDLTIALVRTADVMTFFCRRSTIKS
jgi:hypothetical protein